MKRSTFFGIMVMVWIGFGFYGLYVKGGQAWGEECYTISTKGKTSGCLTTHSPGELCVDGTSEPLNLERDNRYLTDIIRELSKQKEKPKPCYWETTLRHFFEGGFYLGETERLPRGWEPFAVLNDEINDVGVDAKRKGVFFWLRRKVCP